VPPGPAPKSGVAEDRLLCTAALLPPGLPSEESHMQGSRRTATAGPLHPKWVRQSLELPRGTGAQGGFPAPAGPKISFLPPRQRKRHKKNEPSSGMFPWLTPQAHLTSRTAALGSTHCPSGRNRSMHTHLRATGALQAPRTQRTLSSPPAPFSCTETSLLNRCNQTQHERHSSIPNFIRISTRGALQL